MEKGQKQIDNQPELSGLLDESSEIMIPPLPDPPEPEIQFNIFFTQNEDNEEIEEIKEIEEIERMPETQTTPPAAFHPPRNNQNGIRSISRAIKSLNPRTYKIQKDTDCRTHIAFFRILVQTQQLQEFQSKLKKRFENEMSSEENKHKKLQRLLNFLFNLNPNHLQGQNLDHTLKMYARVSQKKGTFPIGEQKYSSKQFLEIENTLIIRND